jgi:putative membrane protein
MLLWRERVLLFLKGMAMGAADSVPGVSGGTIAFIANIYDELLDSINAVNLRTLQILLGQGPGKAWKAINGNFLLTLGSGILLSLILFANVVLYLLAEHFPFLMSFFTGLIAASVWYVNQQIPEFTAGRMALFVAGIVFSVGLALLPPASGADNLLYYFFCGALAICAMILPGISGAFILLLLGAYEPVLTALTGMDWPVIVVFAAGCATGLLSFSRFLSWLLHAWRPQTLALLLGVLAGSLYSLWPWRELIPPTAVEAAVNLGDAQYQNVGVLAWSETNGRGAALLCLLLGMAGFTLVWGLETLGSKFGAKSTSSGSPGTNSF